MMPLRPTIWQLSAIAIAVTGILVTLYLTQKKRRRVFVPLLLLWQQLEAIQPTWRVWMRWRRRVSLLLAILIAWFIVAALSNRDLHKPQQTNFSLYLIENGLPMRAIESGISRLDDAKLYLREQVRQVDTHHRSMIAEVGAVTVPLGPFTADAEYFVEQIDRLKPTDTVADFRNALRFSCDMLAKRHSANLIIIASPQTVIPPLPCKMKNLYRRAAGNPTVQVALTSFQARSYPDDRNRYQVMLRTWNGLERPQAATLKVFAGAALLLTKPITLQPSQRQEYFIDDLAVVHPSLSAELALDNPDQDPLHVDNKGYVQLRRTTPLRILCVTTGNRYLEAALLLDDQLDLKIIAPGEYSEQPRQPVDIFIFDRFVPEHPPSKPSIYILPQQPSLSFPFDAKGQVQAPRFDYINQNHPTMQWVDLYDANIKSSLHVIPQPADAVIAADTHTPLIIAGKRQASPFVAISFDITQSDLPLRFSWPIFVLNIIDWLQPIDPTEALNLTVGHATRIPWSQDETLTLTDPLGGSRAMFASEGSAVITTELAGFHIMRSPTHQVSFASAISPFYFGEMNNAATTTKKHVHLSAPPRVSPNTSAIPLWMWFVSAAFVLLCIEWITFHKRWTE